MSLKIILFHLLLSLGIGNGNPISWNDELKLSWDHFKGPAQRDVGAVAVTASGITFSYSLHRNNNTIVGFDALVEAHFYPDHSWYLKEKTDDYILSHEQLHFDITELHVRKLRKKIKGLKVHPAIKSQLDELHESAKKSLRAMQRAYDSETENSIKRENQLKWNKFVQLELDKYKDYSSR